MQGRVGLCVTEGPGCGVDVLSGGLEAGGG